MSIPDKALQEYLKLKGYYRGKIDGVIGLKSWQAILDMLEVRRNELTDNPLRWGRARRKAAVQQLMCKDLDIRVGSIDGLIGPQTLYAFEVWERLSVGKKEDLWRDEEELKPQKETEVRPDLITKKTVWPTQRQVRSQQSRYFGRVGTNQTMLTLPFHLRIAWNLRQKITRFSCHEKVHDSLLRIFTNTMDHYGESQFRKLGLDLFGGCLNVRAIRGGSVYSIHSWGCAVDLDPARNQLRWKDNRAEFAKPVYEPFWRIVGDEGWIGLGPARNYDWMHFQAARL